MRIHLLAAGTRRPGWEREGYDEYARRMPREYPLLLKEIPVSKRSPGANLETLIAREGERMLKSAPPGSRIVGLDERGEGFDTRALARKLARWQGEGRDLCLLIGGPDGLAADARQAAESLWSLSPLTLPHGLVRVVVAEQLYRATSLLRGHPYHRD